MNDEEENTFRHMTSYLGRYMYCSDICQVQKEDRTMGRCKQATCKYSRSAPEGGLVSDVVAQLLSERTLALWLLTSHGTLLQMAEP